MSSQYLFAPYQDPPEDIPAHEREQAAFTASAPHYSLQDGPGQEEAFLSNTGTPDERVNQYEASLPFAALMFVGVY
jgi:hypothetical protein